MTHCHNTASCEMARIKYLLLLLVFVKVHRTRSQDSQSTFPTLNENIKRDVQEFIQRTLSESDEKHAAQIQRALSESDEKHAAQIQRLLSELENKHAAQIASLRTENELLIQKMTKELSKKYAADMVTLRNEFETQNGDLRMRLEMITDIVEGQEKRRTIDHQMNNYREAQPTSPDETFSNANRSVDETNGSLNKPMSSFMSTKRDRNSSPVSQIGQIYTPAGHHRGYMHERTDRQVSGESRVAFYATMEADNTHLGVNDDIVFQHVITNTGTAYNSHHGIFIAPVDGVYVFSCTLFIYVDSYAHFMVNGDIVAKFYLLSSSEQSSQTIIVNLRKGYDVSVQNVRLDMTVHGDKYSTFSGFLLYEDATNGPAIVG